MEAGSFRGGFADARGGDEPFRSFAEKQRQAPGGVLRRRFPEVRGERCSCDRGPACVQRTVDGLMKIGMLNPDGTLTLKVKQQMQQLEGALALA